MDLPASASAYPHNKTDQGERRSQRHSRTQVLPGETITVYAPFNSVDSWGFTGAADKYGLDPAADRYIFAGFRIRVVSGSGVKNCEIDDVKLVP